MPMKRHAGELERRLEDRPNPIGTGRRPHGHARPGEVGAREQLPRAPAPRPWWRKKDSLQTGAWSYRTAVPPGRSVFRLGRKPDTTLVANQSLQAEGRLLAAATAA